MEHNFERLRAHILPPSVALHFDAARREWDLIGIEVSEEFDNCPCGQEIKEHCFIRNLPNGNTTYVGRREGVLSATYGIQLVGQKGDASRTLVLLNNPSALLVRARFAGNFRVYGEPVQAAPLYDGKDVWLLFPQQLSQGWFEVSSLLEKKGKSVAAMIAECTEANRTEQLTMVLAIEFWDELGARRELPGSPSLL